MAKESLCNYRDQFDRIPIAQSIREKLFLLTVDDEIKSIKNNYTSCNEACYETPDLPPAWHPLFDDWQPYYTLQGINYRYTLQGIHNQ